MTEFIIERPANTTYSVALIGDDVDQTYMKETLLQIMDAALKAWRDGDDIILYARQPNQWELAKWKIIGGKKATGNA